MQSLSWFKSEMQILPFRTITLDNIIRPFFAGMQLYYMGEFKQWGCPTESIKQLLANTIHTTTTYCKCPLASSKWKWNLGFLSPPQIWRRCFHFDSLIVGHRFIISGRTAPLVFVTQFHRKKQSDSHKHNLQPHRWMHFFFSHLSCANFGRYNTNVFDIKISQDGQLLNITAKKRVKTWREITK